MQIKKLQKNKRLGFIYKFSDKASGFTLVEIMVATSIFMVVMLIAMGSLIMVSGSAKKAKALNFTMDNLNFAMESMTRSLRMGVGYHCSPDEININNTSVDPKDCSSGSFKIAFNPSKSFGAESGSIKMAYWIVEKENGTYTIVRCSSNSSYCTGIISENIEIDGTSRFYVRGSEKESPGPQIQPSVYLVISGSINIKNEKIPFAIQTMVSQRVLDYQL
jgi:type II secretory pathway pseudopilin PulG